MILATVAACQVTTSQTMGSGVTIRSAVPIGNESATHDQTIDDQDAEAKEDRIPDITIGGGFDAGVSH